MFTLSFHIVLLMTKVVKIVNFGVPFLFLILHFYFASSCQCVVSMCLFLINSVGVECCHDNCGTS